MASRYSIALITAKPCDIKVLQEYNTDPRVVSNLIDGVYFTRLHKVKSHQTVIQITKKRVLIKFNIQKMMGPVGYPEIIYRSSIKDLHGPEELLKMHLALLPQDFEY
ncbi:uncharacterized protein LOC124456571 isoform X2 [Xenia sp. Carnegie-2017]|uniref:uncharacterized protein LOC124456571 isoform X2 n=1 Tax=Xenia sp. Carnegie-2017 TaxID=2897299 RepID=UPI001F048853|nr:uncharacterized protein LOC124456571 isoform X2 [Xenia sp. Carnegie-2017]